MSPFGGFFFVILDTYGGDLFILKKMIVFGCLFIFLGLPCFAGQGSVEWEVDKEAVHAFFVLSQEVAIHQLQLESLKEEQVQIDRKIVMTSELMSQSKIKQEKLLKQYALYLKNRQVQGNYYYIEQLIQSNSIRSFLDKVYAYHILEQTTNRLYDEIIGETEFLTTKTKELNVLKAQNKKVIESSAFELNNMVRKRESLNVLLKKYEGDQAFMAYLKALENRWQSIQPTFLDKINTFNILISDQILPESIFNINITNNKIYATLVEERFNEALKDQSKVADMSFNFSTRGVDINFESLNVKLFGVFILDSPQKIIFEVKEGYFEDQVLSQMVIDYFLKQKNIQFDLSTMLGKSKIEKLNTKHREIELIVHIRLF